LAVDNNISSRLLSTSSTCIHRLCSAGNSQTLYNYIHKRLESKRIEGPCLRSRGRQPPVCSPPADASVPPIQLKYTVLFKLLTVKLTVNCLNYYEGYH